MKVTSPRGYSVEWSFVGHEAIVGFLRAFGSYRVLLADHPRLIWACRKLPDYP